MILLPTAHCEHILRQCQRILCCVLGLEPRTSHLWYCTTNCVSSPPFILYLHMYMCMCVLHVFVQACIYVEDGDCWSGRQKLMSHVFLNCSSFYFLRQGLIHLGNTVLFFTAWPGSPGYLLFLSLQCCSFRPKLLPHLKKKKKKKIHGCVVGTLPTKLSLYPQKLA